MGRRGQRLRLWRARRSSFRFLCLRIFFRRFLITLPKTHLERKIESRRLDTLPRAGSQPATVLALQVPRSDSRPGRCQGRTPPPYPVAEFTQPTVDPVPAAEETQHRTAAHPESVEFLDDRIASGVDHQPALQVPDRFGLEPEREMDPRQVVVEKRVEELFSRSRTAEFQRAVETTLGKAQTKTVVGAKTRIGRIDALCRSKLLQRLRCSFGLQVAAALAEVVLRRNNRFHGQSPKTHRGSLRGDASSNRKERAGCHSAQPSAQHAGFGANTRNAPDRPTGRSQGRGYETVLLRFENVRGSRGSNRRSMGSGPAVLGG